MPSYMRPQRTKRMLYCLLNQNFNGFELLFIGDSCPVYDVLMEDPWFANWKKEFEQKGNYLVLANSLEHKGCYGAHAIKYAVEKASGEYFCWVNNDDILTHEHITNYHRSIFKTDLDFVYNDTLVNTGGVGLVARVAQLKEGCIGHSELVVRTDFLKKIFKDDYFFSAYCSGYGHDWQLVKMMMRSSKYAHGPFMQKTYIVMSTPTYQEQGID